MIIRKFREEDAAELARMHRNTIRSVNAKDYTKKQIEAWSSYSTAANKRKSALRGYTYVAIKKGKVVGFVKLRDEFIKALYIHKDYQGQGIASKLLVKAESIAKRQGIKTLKLESTITAHDFYKRKGYKGNKKSYYKMGRSKLPVYVMKKNL